MDTIFVVIGCDGDPDRADYGGTRYDNADGPLKWVGLEQTFAFTRELTTHFHQQHGLSVRWTLNIRVDDQVERAYQDSAWVLKAYGAVLQAMEQEGHEIAWHPHLWRWSAPNGCWMQEMTDNSWIQTNLSRWHASFISAWGRAPRTVHGGWMHQNDVSMQTLDQLGISVEYSAIPGSRSPGSPTQDGSDFCGAFDWSICPPHAYYPSPSDYRTGSPHPTVNSLQVLEVPTFTFNSTGIDLLRAIADFRRLRGKKRWSSFFNKNNKTIFVNAASPPVMFQKSFHKFMRVRHRFPVYVTYFHADELLTDQCRSYRRWLYHPDHLKRNIAFMIETASGNSVKIEFIRAEDVPFRLGHERPSPGPNETISI